MAMTARTQKKTRGQAKRSRSVNLLDDMPITLSRSTSLDTLTVSPPRRIRLIPFSGPRTRATIGVELPEGTVTRLIVLDDENALIDTLIDGWLPAGAHELRELCLPNGTYKLRLETPNAWYVAGIIIG